MASSPYTRRRLIAASAGAAGALAVGSRITDSSASPSPGHAIVVGAGLAGLSAAYELEQRGWQTTVLEARARLGGRVRTIDLAGGQHAEAGGEFIDTRHTKMRSYCRRFGLRLEDSRRGFGGLDDLIHRRGRTFPVHRFRNQRTRRQLNEAWRRTAELARPLTPSDPSANGGGRIDRRSYADFLNELGTSGRARFLLEQTIRDEYGAEPDAVSLLFVALTERVAWDQPDAGVEAFRVAGGNRRLVDAFASRLAAPPRLSSVVTRISHGSSGVEVSLAGGETISGSACVVAAPMAALRSVEFSPGLPAAMARAVSELDNCDVTKVVMQFRRRFWRRQGFSGDISSDLPVGSSWEATDQQDGSRGALISYAAGRAGRRLAAKSPARREALARRSLARAYPRPIPAPLRTESVGWPVEVFSGGAWAVYRPRQVLDLWPQLHQQKPGPLQFAGEHADRVSGYMEGAVRSGARAAKRLSY